jgi:maleate cis-trans isomerase
MAEVAWRPAAGWRARIGILVIDKDTVPEVEFQAMAPPGVTVHTARFASPRQSGSGSYGDDPARTVVESPDIARGLDHLGRIGLDAITLCFVTGSFFGGLAFDDAFAEQAGAKAHGCRVGTAAGAVRAALAATGVRHPFLVAPPWFNDLIAAHAVDYFTAAGLEPAGLTRYDLGPAWHDAEPWQVWDGNGQQHVRADELYRQVRTLLPPAADGVAVLGNGLLAADAVAPLEADLGVPVVTSNQAALWQCLRSSGVSASPSGYGRLFDQPLLRENARV